MDFINECLATYVFPSEGFQEAETARDIPFQTDFLSNLQAIILPPMPAAELFLFSNRIEFFALTLLPLLCGYLGVHYLFKNLFRLTLLCAKLAMATICALWLRYFFVEKQISFTFLFH